MSARVVTASEDILVVTGILSIVGAKALKELLIHTSGAEGATVQY